MKLLFAAVSFALSVVLFVGVPTVALPSENVVIAQVQTGGTGPGTATQEFILLYNDSESDVDVTDWCIEYSSSNDNAGFKSCVETPDLQTEIWLLAGGFISFSTQEFDNYNVDFVSDFMMSGGMSGTSGHVRLFDSADKEVDKLGWGSAISPEGIAATVHNDGQVMSRDFAADEMDTDVNAADFSSRQILSLFSSGLYEVEIVVDLCLNIGGIQAELPDGYLPDSNENCFVDFCPNLDDLQIEAPAGYYKPTGEEDCLLKPLEDATLLITELLPNAPSFDTGLEFIEIYNPNDVAIELNGYKLQLGLSFTKEFVFVSGAIDSGDYITLSDSETGITLPNTSASSVRLIAPAGNAVSETAVYSNANDDVSWALVSDIWIYTNQITPGSANKPYLEPAEEEVLGVTSVLAPCPAGKYRNPATNRCRNIKTAVSQLAPCSAGQERNPDTNRCRNVTVSSSSLVPCSSGQTRNPATNRCRTASGNSTLVPCKEGQVRNSETNRCRNISVLGGSTELASVTDIAVESSEGQLNWLVILVAIGSTIIYMVYEWRSEIGYKIRRIQARA